MTAADAPLTDDERAQLDREFRNAAELDAPYMLYSYIESILLARETALRETIAQEIREREAQARRETWVEAITAAERQTDLTEMVHFDKPSDFRKGVMTCIVALRAAAVDGGQA